MRYYCSADAALMLHLRLLRVAWWGTVGRPANGTQRAATQPLRAPAQEQNLDGQRQSIKHMNNTIIAVRCGPLTVPLWQRNCGRFLAALFSVVCSAAGRTSKKGNERRVKGVDAHCML
jgi:hypothetical protein